MSDLREFQNTAGPAKTPLFSFAIIADTHIMPETGPDTAPYAVLRKANQRVRLALKDLRTRQPQFVIHLGDMVRPFPALPNYDEVCELALDIFREIPCPVHYLPGNHDIGDKPIASAPAPRVCNEFVAKYKFHFGSLYIDDGKPSKDLFPKTLRNMQDHVGTLGFNVPIGWSLTADALEKDTALRRRFFADLDLIFYAGAALPVEVWARLEGLALAETGRKPLMTSSWGMTETAPATLVVHEPIGETGVIGVPVPGVIVKLLPDADERFELRVKGPNNMAEYYDDPVKTAEAFDPEGFLITGDAVKFRIPGDPNAGLVFDGRMSEDFKLMTGTWVQTAKLRAQAMTALGGLVQDVVVTGHGRTEIGILVFPNADGMAALGIAPDAGDGVLTGPDLTAYIGPRLAGMAATATGSSTRIIRALVLGEPPSLQHHEMTTKGNLNTRQVLTRRAGLVDRLYNDNDPAVIKAQGHPIG